MGYWKCSKCGKKWESDDECERIDGKPVCSDCYYETLGDFIEDHPIGFPRGARAYHQVDGDKKHGKKES
jgi:NAD-dependent SIR2 family protein deacetylase